MPSHYIVIHDQILYFQDLLTENRDDILDMYEKDSIEQEDSHIYFTMEIVKDAIKLLKNNKSIGIGGIPAKLIKFGTEKLYQLLVVPV